MTEIKRELKMGGVRVNDSLFFELVHISLGRSEAFAVVPSDEKWVELFDMAKKQALVGVLFSGVERLPEDQKPPKSVLLQWFLLVSRIEERNKVLNRQAARVSERFAEDGYRSCILKGQGNSLLYPYPLRRQSGDIDIWVEGGRDKILKYLRTSATVGEILYHHADFKVLKDTEIEVHFTPSWMFNPVMNVKLQRWFKEEACRQFIHEVELPEVERRVCVPTADFNVVYLLVHIYRHLFDEGIGLRQLLDYYYLLLHIGRRNGESCDWEAVNRSLKTLELLKFMGAVMYVMREVFGLERKYMPVEPDEVEGRFLLDEVMAAGNFGHGRSVAFTGSESLFHRFVRRQTHNMAFLKRYPSEIVWSPIFSVGQRCWRMMKGYV